MGRIVRFPPPEASGPDPDHPLHHVPSVAGAVEAFFAGRIWLLRLAVLTARPSTPLFGFWTPTDRPVTDLDPDRVAAVFGELWAGRAPATWNTRRVAAHLV